VELVKDGVNGGVARSLSPADLAAAYTRPGSRSAASTCPWAATNAARLSLDRSLETLAAAYRSTRV
jgi:hypothetical protein